MTRPTILLLLSLFSLSLASPIDPQTSANRFYGQIFEKYFAEAYEELFDLLYGKWNSFYPGLFKDDEIVIFKKDFAAFFENEGKLKLSLADEQLDAIGERFEKEMNDRVAKMTEEGRRFVTEQKKDAKRKAMGDFNSEFAEFRKKYDSLSAATRASIEAQLPIFGKLQELQAHVNVVDRVLRHLSKLAGKKYP
ncbi:hypothetical protein PMAYCL1PPCAC_28094 [Pristionchus mayeri]|uniref:SXP/RAL-2 family protein Ani s 5-like cation-binding domain-containing protein n=1 Tax=Pristionchus mayeri TaxID=1317129 RepID=A0AAN5IAW9_9BILA|nr:hypothetical protein PMAYCL1PPCAC_28094 [Pristionchus mayeri]